MAERKAASVLPEPVGAAIRVWRPSRMAGQPSRCGSVGSPKRPANHSRTAGWNADRADMSPILPASRADGDLLTRVRRRAARVAGRAGGDCGATNDNDGVAPRPPLDPLVPPGPPLPLADAAAGDHPPPRLHAPAAGAPQLVVQVGHHAGVVGQEA